MQKGHREMAIAGSCVSTMEKPRFSITASSGSAPLLCIQNTRKGHTKRLASFASHRQWRYDSQVFILIIRHGQRHHST